MAIFFGSDYSTFRPDGTYGLTYVRITGPRVPLEAVARRWLCDPGDLPADPNGGFNILRLENARNRTPQGLLTYQILLIREAKKVDFVLDAVVRISYVASVLSVNGKITLADFTDHPLLLTAAQNTAARASFPSANLPALA